MSFRKIIGYLLLSSLLIISQPTTLFAVDRSFYSGNDILYYDPDATDPCGNMTAGSAVTGDGNVAKMWNYFVGKGLSNEQAAGILGNIQEESGFSPFRQEGAASWPSGGYGIVQWTASRRIEIVAKMNSSIPQLMEKYYSAKYGGATSPSKGYVPDGVEVEANDQFLTFELDYLYQESTTRKVRSGIGAPSGVTEWEAIKAAKTLREASDIWLKSFERPADQSDSHAAKRAGNGEKILEEMKKLPQTSVDQNGDAVDTTTSTDPTTSAVKTVSAANKGTIFIDPGHGGSVSKYTDEKSGLVASESHNTPETEDMLKVANRVKTELEKNGYTVLLARTTNDQQVKFRERADAAIAAKASLGISLHSDDTVGEAWAQREGAYRQYGDKKVTFTNKDTATKSQQYNAAIAKARSAAEGRSIGLDADGAQQTKSFGREGIYSKGNTPLISLFADTVPWSYNEFARGTDGKMDEGEIAKYTKGIVDGVVAANPSGAPATTGGCTDSSNFGGGDLSATTLAYAWPTYKGKGGDATQAKKEYEKAVADAQKLGEYVGGTIAWCRTNKGKSVFSDGVDCGGFVTRLVTDSNWDPGYNYNGKGGPTPTQEKWLQENWQKLGRGSEIDTGTLKAGDVAMLPGHTFIYVGDIPGFSSKIASASLCNRAPMAGKESLTDSDVTWYRKK